MSQDSDIIQAGKNATRVEEIAWRVNDSSRPYYWEDAGTSSNLCYPPPGSGAFTVDGGIYSIYVWVKDDYCENGSSEFAYIEIIGD